MESSGSRFVGPKPMKFKHSINCHECLFSIVPPLEHGHFALAQTIESLKIGKASYIV